MSLRLKIGLILISFAVLAAGFILFYWMPQSERQSARLLTAFTERHLNTVAEGLVPNLWRDQLAAVREELDSLLEKNSDWAAIDLHDSTGRHIYPLGDHGSRPTGEFVHTFKQDITYRAEKLGQLTLTVDFRPDLDDMRQNSFLLALGLVTGLLFIILAIAFSLDMFVRRPAQQLVLAANRLAKNDFSSPLPQPRKDEIGELILSFAAMRDSIALNQKELIESQEQLVKFRRFADASGQGLAMATLEGRITYANPHLCKMIGRDFPEALVGTSLQYLYPKEIRGQVTGEIIPTVMQEGQWVGEIEIETAFRNRVDTIEIFFLIHDDSAAPHSIALVVTDITERKAAEKALQHAHDELEFHVDERTAELRETNRALRAAKEQAELANRAKTEFLSAMSHELRTPLNAIIGFSEIMHNGLFGSIGNAQYAGYVRDIHDSGNHLLSLINDMLDIAKTESGRAELMEEVIDLEEVVESCFRLVESRANEANVVVRSYLPPTLPRLYADKRKVKQILLNLVSNAVKFTPQGGEVSISAEAPDQDHISDQAEFVLKVADTGIGIAPKDIDKALTPFGQIDSKLGRKHVGTGLGLPLSKILTELHGGSLELTSKPGVGTTVTVNFPASRIRRARRAPHP